MQRHRVVPTDMMGDECENHIEIGLYDLRQRNELRQEIASGGPMRLQALIGALIFNGVRFESELVEEVKSIAGPVQATLVPTTLSMGCSECGVQLWHREENGAYHLEAHVFQEL